MILVRDLEARAGTFTLGPLSFEVPAGAYVVWVGPSGHGKSTLLGALAGVRGAKGELRVSDARWTGLPPHRRSLGWAPQGGQLFPHLSVAENVAFGAAPGAALEALARTWGIEALWNRMPAKLSGGETMRVALARALARKPELLLLDEPLSAIDEAGRASLLAQLRGLRGSCTVLHVTHDLDEAAALATHLGVLRNGKLAAFGPLDEILLRPPTPEVASFLGVENVLDGRFEPHGEDASLFHTRGLVLHVLDRAEGEGFVSIPERAVMLSVHPPEQLSARNSIPGLVAAITPDRHGVRVTLDGPLPLVARLERESVEALALSVGKRVVAVVKAAQVRVLGTGVRAPQSTPGQPA